MFDPISSTPHFFHPPFLPPLDVAEESWIRQLGGPTNNSNPDGLLSNKRYQMNDVRYRAAGGTVDKP